MNKNYTVSFWVVNLESTQGSLNPQGDKLEFTKERIQQKIYILSIIYN